MRYCPCCDSLLTADTEVYTRRRRKAYESVEVIGCENCMRATWADEFFDEEELLEMENDNYDNYLWDMSQEMKAMLKYREAEK